MTDVASAPTHKSKRINGKTLVIRFFLFLFVAGSIGAAGYFYYQNRQLTASIRQAEEVRAQVARLMELPDEQPTIATVTDKEKLKDQPFFSRAENDDRVLIFPNSRKAILYRPKTKKIVDVTTLTIQGNANGQVAGAETQQTQSASFTVAFYNGTDVAGATDKVSADVQTAVAGATVGRRAQASRQDYQQTIVVDVSGKPSQALAVAQYLGTQVVSLPDGEARPAADVLVIIGRDRAN